MAEPRRILYVAWAPFFSGAERALLLLLRGLDPARFRAVVAVGTDGEFRRQLSLSGIESVVVPIRYSSRRHPVQWLRSVAALRRVMARTRPSLVHANDVPSFQPAGYAARWQGLETIVHVRFHETSSSYRWFLKPGFSRAVFISHSMLDEGLEHAPDLFANRSDVVYDGVVVPPLPRPDEQLALKGSLGLPHGTPSVLLSGQVAEIKGLWDYIEAARLLLASGVEAVFVVAGEDLRTNGAVRHEAEQRVRDLGMEQSFRFTGFREDAAALASAVDVVAVPSHREPLGLSALEAMALGRPVVASRVGGLAETVVDGETGLLVPPKDPRALAESLRALLFDPERGSALGAAARRRVQQRFSVERHALDMQAVYDRLLSGGAPATQAPPGSASARSSAT